MRVRLWKRVISTKCVDVLFCFVFVFMWQTGGSLQQRADAWLQEVNSTRALEYGKSPSMRSSESSQNFNDYRRDTGGLNMNNSKLRDSAANAGYNPGVDDEKKVRPDLSKYPMKYV